MFGIDTPRLQGDWFQTLNDTFECKFFMPNHEMGSLWIFTVSAH